MKKKAFLPALLLLAVGVSGCPVYDDDSGCFDDYDCEYGYVCDAPTGTCYAERDEPDDESRTCRKPSDCGNNETCSRFGTCSNGDCHYSTVGCVKGYSCSLEENRYRCVDSSSSGGSGGDSGVGGDGNVAGQMAAAGAGG